MKKPRTLLTIFILAAFMIVPVYGIDQNITNSTTVPTIIVTTAGLANTTPGTPNTTGAEPVNITVTVSPVINLSQQVSANVSVPVTTVPVTTVPVTTVPFTTLTNVITPAPVATQVRVGNISFASSPLGASILIDGVYYGLTPENITGISAGNHIVRLTMSGYYDYEGSFSAVPGQFTSVFGTLPPSGTPITVTTTAPAVTVLPTPASSGGIFDNPAVIASIIGVIAAVIGAAATILPHIINAKKK
jgi:hypothetical protein